MHPHASAEFEVSKSRFLAQVVPITALSELAPLVAFERREHPAAHHVCSAARVGLNGEYSRSSDDGEPSGTAGMPILGAITSAGVSDVCVLVTRYFGGVKLGTGGLARAYSAAAKQALSAGRTIQRREGVRVSVALSFEQAPKFEHVLRLAGLAPSLQYSEVVQLSVAVARTQLDEVLAIFANASLHPELGEPLVFTDS
ncbi:IMPACT family protein [Humidisolicoccus flavus]|uniref:IMPACT family protein n=1 Tax=Humidisolicoccus flavus TaxID=3111414 RepID=UPI003245CD0B